MPAGTAVASWALHEITRIRGRGVVLPGARRRWASEGIRRGAGSNGNGLRCLPVRSLEGTGLTRAGRPGRSHCRSSPCACVRRRLPRGWKRVGAARLGRSRPQGLKADGVARRLPCGPVRLTSSTPSGRGWVSQRELRPWNIASAQRAEVARPQYIRSAHGRPALHLEAPLPDRVDRGVNEELEHERRQEPAHHRRRDPLHHI
jgi:hypothetical protein